MTMMITTSPGPPLGPYPQLRLCDHRGIAPGSIDLQYVTGSVTALDPDVM